VNEIGAILISVTMVLFFGEIVPQSICKRFGLGVGFYCRHIVWVLLAVALPISLPLGRLLDHLLGEEDVLFRRAQLKALVNIHGSGGGHGGDLTADETTIISGALDMTHKTAGDVMTPLARVVGVAADTAMSWEGLRAISACGHSRLPVHAPGEAGAIVGLLLVKELFGCLTPADLADGAEARTIARAVPLRALPRMNHCTPLYTALNFFQTGRSHMALVTTGPTVLFLDTPGAKGMDSGGGAARAARLTPQLFATPRSPRGAEARSPPSAAPPGSAADPLTPIILPRTASFNATAEDEVLGIITLEDVLEELLGEEILDEHDRTAGDEASAQHLVEEQLATHLKAPRPLPRDAEESPSPTLDSPGRGGWGFLRDSGGA